MVLGMWQYYYTIRDEFCQPLLYTKFKKKEVDRVREERDRIRLMLYRNTLTNAWLVNRLEERGVMPIYGLTAFRVRTSHKQVIKQESLRARPVVVSCMKSNGF